MRVLGLETSCDECSAAVVEDGRIILSNIIATQIEEHKPFEGVVPELASRLHTEWISTVVQTALDRAGLKSSDIDAVAVTNRPGLLGSLLVGLSFAKGFAASLDLPFITIDHIRAHLFASQIEQQLEYPYLGVLVSGGHTVICRVDGYDTIEVLGTTIDDAIGEAFDKVAKHYGFGYPGGVAIDNLAKQGNPLAFLFPGSSLHAKDHPYDISYSGLKTAAINQLDSFWDGVSEKSPENIAASFQRSAVNMLVKRVRLALQETGLRRLSVGGGVAANSYLRSELLSLREGGYEVAFPSLKLCTDNGAMIAALAYQYLRDGITSDFTESASARVTAFKKQYP
ncbi:MAG: tRNA (adenosine(37)-N6)-threonylcarbamoyltransferase complex transferase subunit TsaD [Sphaerochaeta sp.]|uniref:tRNA (adenosine(37)-N6)-threonylcarbamoyltransferase complex transferase subunit TsaD n=1 Tax=Sphaerochaeta sp. TaxID=1972642 RepID=UPI001D4A9F3F|nr:tRNA (adenosine(37)-N6)-threonylcarbamoyltransferase complex transferase subunit TsaD [Sphaerochaeta sp.]NCC13263.1 tRNA (adenosine(37)-N6)-threonylcarbamoyltransferase complex transferase subunit TsaD [Spirochaetia bacterium]NCC89131.1 tRNA (adenosine(37)-N6)-threonylcarbamoyltransferase complex transferase subunit TsaD [Spirochaetia bacterium]